MKPILAAVAFLLVLALSAHSALAEVFELVGGGRIVGELVNRNENRPKQYVIQVADGAQVTLDATQVEKVRRLRGDEAEYERIRPTYADTAAAQWELAQWCLEHKLKTQRETHLRRVIELDPEHVEARHALGYSQLNGKWTTRDEVMIDRGYRKYKGKWMSPQEIEALENERNGKATQQEWFAKVKRWRGWLNSDRDQQVRDARDNIRGLTDPQAVRALTLGLRDEGDPHVRLLFVDALANIGDSAAAMSLAIAAMSDDVEEVRFTCLDRLQAKKRPEVISYFVGKLKDRKSNNETVNLAGVALGRMKDPSAIGPLIDAVVTVHKFIIPKAGGDGSTSATFGGGPGHSGGGLSAGGGPTVIHQPMNNPSVLDALVSLTGQNFGYDKQAWKSWYSAQRKAPRCSTRGAIEPRCRFGWHGQLVCPCRRLGRQDFPQHPTRAGELPVPPNNLPASGYCGYHGRIRTSVPLWAPTSFLNDSKSAFEPSLLR